MEYTVADYEKFEKTGNYNHFEEVIDQIILNDTKLPDDLKEKIKTFSVAKKREAILVAIDGDRNLYTKISKLLFKKELGKMEALKQCILMLREYVKVGKVEKKKFGEVMTPLELVKEMLSTLPDEVWNDPSQTFFDSSNGTGAFPLMIIYKLMEGLKDWEPDEDKRYKHIIENMIYVCELQPINMFLWLCLIDPFDEYKCNIYTGSFLDEGFDYHMKNVWKIDGFSVSVGNPPFNQMIDLKFVRKMYEFCDKILIVHPSTWLLDEKNKQKQFTLTKDLIKDDLESIVLFNGNGVFGISLFVPCVITYINKNKRGDKIKCKDKINDIELRYDNIYDINKFSNISEYFSIKKKIEDKIDTSLWFVLKNNKNINGMYHINIAQIRGNVNMTSDLSNIDMVQDDFYTLITRDSKIDNEPKKHNSLGFVKKNTANNFLNYLKTNFIRFCLSIYKNNSQLTRGEMDLIPWLDFTQEWTDEKLYKHFNITENEQKFIEKHIPKYY